MSKLFKCASCCSKSSSHPLDTEEYDQVGKGKDVLTWNIPTLPTSKIYRTKLFNGSPFSPNSLIRTKEGQCSLDEAACLNLLCGSDFWVHNSSHTSSWHLQNEYHSIHVGMVQIGVKTLTRKPLNATLLMSLRDARQGKLQDSLLAMVETSLSHGPVYFNVFPNITESLSKPARLLDLLLLDVKVRDFENLPAVPDDIVFIYRVCYKVVKPGIQTRGLLESPNERTVFFVDTNNNVLDQKVTVWDKVQLPQNWPLAL